MMDRLTATFREHWKKLAIAAAAVLLLPAASNAVRGGDDLVLAANAPQHGESMRVVLGAKGGWIGGCSGEAEVEIRHDDWIAYPRSRGAFEMDGCRGAIDIPYREFASQNGVYLVEATFDGKSTTTRVMVEKVVNWVYVRAFDEPNEERTRIDVAFDRAIGQPLTSSVFSSGTLVLDIVYEECTPEETIPLEELTGGSSCTEATGDNVFHAEIPVEDRASAVVFIPWENLDEDNDEDEQATEGWYNVTATYHNDEARSNDNVPMDPTVYDEDPPGNWFKVDYQ